MSQPHIVGGDKTTIYFVQAFQTDNIIELVEKLTGSPYTVHELWRAMEEHGYVADINKLLEIVLKREMGELLGLMKARKQGPWA